MIRGGQVGFDRSFPGGARVALGTREIGTVRVRLTTLPRPGYDTRQPRADARRSGRRTSSLGTTSPAVTELARRLAALHYAVPSLSSTFSDDFSRERLGLPEGAGARPDRRGRRGVLDEAREPADPAGRGTRSPADHIEVDKTRQVLYLVRDGKIALISPVATAGIAGYYTPEGRFAIYRKVTGWDTSPLGVLLEPDVLRRRLRHPRRRPGAALPGLARLRARAGLRDLPALRAPSRTAKPSTSTRSARRIVTPRWVAVLVAIARAGVALDPGRSRTTAEAARLDGRHRPAGAVLWPKSVTRSFCEAPQVVRYFARTFPQGPPQLPQFDFAHRRLCSSPPGRGRAPATA